ncbi:MAG: tetratricopeptide repeat-containing sensor histidine kinase [Bacteroidota bacterium]
MSNVLFAQHDVVIALQDSLKVAQTDEDRVDLLNEIADKAFEYNLQLSLSSSQEAHDLADSIGYKLGLAKASIWLGKCESTKSRYARALTHFMEALVVYEEEADSLAMADIYKNLANIYSHNGNDAEAMRYYNIAMGIYERLNDSVGQSAILNNIGTIYLGLEGEEDSALYYLNQSRLLNIEINDESSLATNYVNIGYAYSVKEDYPKAIEYYEKCYNLSRKLDSKETMSTALLNIGDSYMYLNDYERAEESVRTGLEIATKNGYRYSEYIGFYTLGEIYQRKENYKESVEWYLKAEEVINEMRDSETLVALMDVQTQQLEAAQKREIERIQAINEERLQTVKFKNLWYLSSAIFALLVLLGSSLYFMKRQKAAMKITVQNKEIVKQKAQIEDQSDKIKQVNETLRVRNKKLRNLNEEKNHLMSVVAHDLKSPLNQINGLANVIKLDVGNLNDTQKECLDKIDVASGRLSNMVSKILNSRNIDHKEESLEIEPVDIEKMAVDLINDYSAVAEKKNISIKKEVMSNGSEVMADRHYLRQVLDNLLSNAIKFSPEGKNIHINLNSADDDIITEVIDEGPGLTNEDKDLLFEEYATLSAKPTGGETSTGLGLAIAKNYVEKMGGEIWCESEFGNGAAFKIKLTKVDLPESV